MIITAIVPCYQEKRTIDKVLFQMSNQECHEFDLEILVVDGGSTDGTLEIIEGWEKKDNRIRLISNPLKTANHAFNLGIEYSKGSHFALINAHTYYPTDYLKILWEAMQATGAVGVSGRVLPVLEATDWESRLVYCISTSAFGVSSQSYRIGKSGFTDSVSLPLFEKKAVITVGGYHPELVRNQDNDMNYKLVEAGHKLYVTSETSASYHPPRSYKKLLKYALKSGVWNTKTLMMKIPCMKWYHFFPGLFFAGEIIGGICFGLSSFHPIFPILGFIWALANGLYFGMAVFFSFTHPQGQGAIRFLLPLGFFFFHLAYGLGNILGLAYQRRNPNF